MKIDTPTTIPMVAFAQISKVDVAKRLVYGRATQEIPDRAGEKFDYAGSKPHFEAWSKSQLEASAQKSAGNIREMHGKAAAGIIPPANGIIFNDAEKAIDVIAHVVDDAAWKKVEAGVYTGFSIGGQYISKSEPDAAGVVSYIAAPSEISLVDRPAVPTATFFEVHKADGTTEKRDFAKPEMVALHVEGKAIGIAVAKADLPAAGAEFEASGRKFSLAKIEGEVANVQEIHELQGSSEELGKLTAICVAKGLSLGDVLAIVEKAAPKVVAPKPEAIEARAREMAKAAGVDPDKQIGLGPKGTKKFAWFDHTAAAEAELVKAAEAEAKKQTEELAKSAAGALAKVEVVKKFADPARKRFPVDTAEQVHAAWFFANQKAVVTSYGDAIKAVHTEILAAAKALSVELEADAEKYCAGVLAKRALILFEPAGPSLAELANDMAKSEKIDLAKLDDKPRAEKVAELEAAARVALFEKMGADDRAVLMKRAEVQLLRKGLWSCARLAELLESLCGLADSVEWEAMHEGDGSTLFDELYACCQMLGGTLQRMVAEELAEATGGAPATAVLAAMQKSAGGLVQKLEKATHTAVSVKRIQKMHDMAKGMGAKCAEVAAVAASDSDKGLVKAALEECTGKISAIALQVLTKAADPVNLPAGANTGGGDALQKAVDAAVAPLKATIQKLESRPEAPRVVVRAIAVEKSQDGGLSAAAQLAADVTPVMKSDGTVDEHATALKIVLRKGGVQVSPTAKPKAAAE